MQTGGAGAPTVLGGYHILVLVTVTLFFLPLAVKINRLAKEADMKALKILSLIAIIVFAVFPFINAIILVVYFVNPGFSRPDGL